MADHHGTHVTGHGTYMAGKDCVFVMHETGTCCLEAES